MSKRLLCLCLCVVMTTGACAQYKRPCLMVKVPDFYEHRAGIEQLTLATDPYFEASKIQHIFNTNVLKKGFLAVHFLAFNYGEKSTFFR